MEAGAKKMQAVYTIIPKPEGRDLWLRVGSAFPNRDGSLTVLLDAVPISGRLQIREYQPRDGASAARESARGPHPQGGAERGVSKRPHEVEAAV